MSWQPGTVVGPYRIERMLGHGGMGQVYLATQRELGRKVAIKVVLEGAIDPEGEIRLQREAQALAKVEHPNVVRVFSSQRLEGRLAVVSEFVAGQTLSQVVEQEGPVGPRQASAWIREAASALAAAHAAGVLHRDLKPENLMCSESGIKVLDFGLAHDAGLSRLTQTGVSLGTPGYMAPEAAAGEPPTAARDIFGLGATLYFLLTGAPPFRGRTALEALTAAALGEFRPVRESAPQVPPWLAAVCERAIAAAPEDRQADMGALYAELEGGARPSTRYGLGVALGVSFVAALGSAIAVGVLLARAGHPETAEPKSVAAIKEQLEERPAAAELPFAFGFTGWPEGDLTTRVRVYEPWAFTRAASGVRVVSRDPSRPELSIPLSLSSGSDWSVQIDLEDLRLGGGSNLHVLFSAGKRTVKQERFFKSVGWKIVTSDETPSHVGLRIALVRGRSAKAIGPVMPLDADPRGPLSVELSMRGEVLSLVVMQRGDRVCESSVDLGGQALPAGVGALRLGQRLLPDREPSSGQQRWALTYTGGHLAFTVSRLECRGAQLALEPELGAEDDALDPGRLGWKFLHGERPDEFVEDLKAYAEYQLMHGRQGVRFARYLQAVHEVRLNKLAAGAERLKVLHEVIMNEGASQFWTDSGLWVRNRLLADTATYPPELRRLIGEGFTDLLLPLKEAVARTEDPTPGEEELREFSSPPEEDERDLRLISQHRRDWAWTEAVLRLNTRQDLVTLRILNGAGLCDEGWARVLAQDADPSAVHDWVVEGNLAYEAGHFKEALARWNKATDAQRKEIPPEALACAQKWAR